MPGLRVSIRPRAGRGRPPSAWSQSRPAMALHRQERPPRACSRVSNAGSHGSHLLGLPSSCSLGARAFRRSFDGANPKGQAFVLQLLRCLQQTVNKTDHGWASPATPTKPRAVGRPLRCSTAVGGQEEAESASAPGRVPIGRHERGGCQKVGCDQSREGDARFGRLWQREPGKPVPKIAQCRASIQHGQHEKQRKQRKCKMADRLFRR